MSKIDGALANREPSAFSKIYLPICAFSHPILEDTMTRFGRKTFIVCTALAGLVLSSGAQAKGCIKGAIVGGVAGSVAGHGKVGAVAGCVIGRHEANKADADKANSQAPAQAK